jgi:hypothetical protein
MRTDHILSQSNVSFYFVLVLKEEQSCSYSLGLTHILFATASRTVAVAQKADQVAQSTLAVGGTTPPITRMITPARASNSTHRVG